MGRTLVFDQRTFPVLRQTASWTDDHFLAQTRVVDWGVAYACWQYLRVQSPLRGQWTPLACATRQCRSATTSTVVQRFVKWRYIKYQGFTFYTNAYEYGTLRQVNIINTNKIMWSDPLTLQHDPVAAHR